MIISTRNELDEREDALDKMASFTEILSEKQSLQCSCLLLCEANHCL